MMKWCGKTALAGLLLLSVCSPACDPSTPPGGEENPEIDPPVGFGGSGQNVFEAGPVSEERIEALHSVSCLVSRTESTPVPSAIEFVVDVSGSMGLAPDTGTDTKWTTTQEALLAALEVLPETTKVGAVFFPGMRTKRHCTSIEGECEPAAQQDRDHCINPDTMIPPALVGAEDSEFRTAFEETILDINPAGGTPTHDALLQGLEELKAGEDDGERFLVLITDGEPTFLEGCTGSGNVNDPVDEQPIVDLIDEAREEGIRTFVVGSPGSSANSGSGDDARPFLSQAAVAGSTARGGCTGEGPEYCHFDLAEAEDFGIELAEAFDDILGEIKSCDIPVPGNPERLEIDPEELNVVIHTPDDGSRIIGKSSEECTSEGWQYTESHESVRLCPAACEIHRQSATTQVELFFGCKAAPILPPT